MLDTIIIILYLTIVLLIGIFSGRNLKTLKDFSISSRSCGSLVIFATLSASFIGGGFSLGNAEKVFLIGIANIAVLWGFSLKEILVATFIAPRIHKFKNAISVGDIMEKAYGKTGKVVTGFLSVLLCAGIVGAQVGGMGYIFSVFLGIEPLYGILIGCAIVISYSTIGGMNAIISTDIIQFICLSIGIPLVVILGLCQIGGIEALKASVPAGHFTLINEHMTITAFISTFLVFVFGETLVPPYVQRLLIGKDKKSVVKGTLFSGIFSIFFFAITGMIGLIALSLNPSIDANLAMPYVIKEVVPIGITGIIIAGMISIVMSSADSFLQSAAVAFINDIVKPLSKKTFSDKTELFMARMTTLITGILAVIFAIKIKSVLDILIYAYNFWAPIILVPLVAVLLGHKTTKQGFALGAIAGVLSNVLWSAMLPEVKFDGLVIGILANFIVFTSVNTIVLSRQKTVDIQEISEI